MATEGMKKLERLYFNKFKQRTDEIGTLWFADNVDITDIAVYETPERIPYTEAIKKDFKPVKAPRSWGEPWLTSWFRLRFEIPKEFKGEKVSLIFDCEGESIIFKNGKAVQGLDTNRKDYILVDKAKGGEKFEIFVETGANCPFGGFVKRTMHQPQVAILLDEVWDCYYDLMCLFEIVQSADTMTGWASVGAYGLPDDSTRRAQIIYQASRAVDLFDYTDHSKTGLRKSARKVRKAIKGLYDKPANASEQTIACMGHAHIDVAWLWPLAETRRKCGRSFSNVLEILDRYPEFIFCQSQPHLYEFTKENYPDVYERIKEKVKTGQWVPTGCAWVEMDCNITGSEALVRQILFGTRFFREEFNHETACLWLPDVFGYAASLPQILKRSGIDNFLTQKISWNQFTEFPHHSFYWEGIDGTEVLSHFLPANDYNTDLHGARMITAARKYKQKDRSPIHAALFGFGDGGGGPTKQMAERIRRFGNLEGVPKYEPMSPAKFFERLENESVNLPKWVGELYLELHRGTLTSQSFNKRFNRKSEIGLRNAEMLETINLTAGSDYRQEQINAAWKLVLLNQFHDIIPGSSIKEVYEDSDNDYAEVLKTANEVTDTALETYAESVDTTGEGKAVVAFNTLSWDREDTVTAKVKGLRKDKTYTAVSTCGCKTPAQVGFDGMVRFTGVTPSTGHAVSHIVSEDLGAKPIKATAKILENELVKVKFDAKGRITSFFDKEAKRETIAPGQFGNQLIGFEDKPAAWEAWDVDLFYNDKPLVTDGKIESVEVVEQGPVRSVVRFTRAFSKSKIIQDVILTANTKRLDFDTTVEWGDEDKILLKVAFPVDVRSDKARYEIQYGNVERPTHWNTPQDFARFEVAAHKWCDLSEAGYGVALLNDCKYGHDIKDNVMRISLLRAPKHPDKTCDINKTHKFVYSMLPHTGSFTNGVVRDAYQLNVPNLAVEQDCHEGTRSAWGSTFSIDNEAVVIESVKKAEDDNSVIVRLYEAHAGRGNAIISTSLPVKKVIETNLMEVEETNLELEDGSVELSFTPFQIRTLKFVL